MPQLINPRLAEQINRRAIEYAYTDDGYYIPMASVDTLDDYGQPTAPETQTAVDCSFTDKPALEKWQGYADVQEIAAEVRFQTPAPEKGGRFIITARFGFEVENQRYEIIGIQDRGAFGYVCALKAVTL